LPANSGCAASPHSRLVLLCKTRRAPAPLFCQAPPIYRTQCLSALIDAGFFGFLLHEKSSQTALSAVRELISYDFAALP